MGPSHFHWHRPAKTHGSAWRKHQHGQVLIKQTSTGVDVAILSQITRLQSASWGRGRKWPKCVVKQTAFCNTWYVRKSSSRCLRKRPKQPCPQCLVQILFASKPLPNKNEFRGSCFRCPSFFQAMHLQTVCNYLVFAIRTDDIKCEPFNKVNCACSLRPQ